MQSEKVNYSVKYASTSHPVSDTNLSASVCQWLPDFLMHAQASLARPLFMLNTSSFSQNVSEKEFKRTALHEQSFVGIQEVISIILAQEKHKVSRSEVTEGTYRMTKVRLETNITGFFSTPICAASTPRAFNSSSIFYPTKICPRPPSWVTSHSCAKCCAIWWKKTSLRKCPCSPK